MSDLELGLQLHPSLATVVERIGGDGWRTDVHDQVAKRMTRLGLGGGVDVRVTRDGTRAAVLRADGVGVPYPPSFLSRLWFGLAPVELRSAAAGRTVEGAFPDSWLVACSDQVTRADDQVGARAIADLVAQLVQEILALRPSALVTRERAAELMRADNPDSALTTDEAHALLAALLDLGVGLGDAGELAAAAHDLRRAGRSAADTMEELFAKLRTPHLEVEVEQGIFEALTSVPVAEDRLWLSDDRIASSLREVVHVVYTHRLQGLGLRLPVQFVRNDTFALPELRVRINDRVSPSIPIPRADEVAVAVEPSVLTGVVEGARPLVDPVSGRELSAVPCSASDALRAAGHLPIPRLSYAAAVFARATTPLAHRLFSIDELEEDLAALEAELPALVHATLARYSLGALTRLLRTLAREQVSIRDLRRVLNALLHYADLTVREVEDMFPDDPLPDRDDQDTSVWIGGVEPRVLAYVRAQLGDRVCHDSGIDLSGSPAVRVHETDDESELVIEDLRLRPDEAEDVLDIIRAELWRALGDDADREPVVVTASRTRLALRRAIEFELPAVRVLARAELPATVRTVPGSPVSIRAPRTSPTCS